jgi:hypothetical protein
MHREFYWGNLKGRKFLGKLKVTGRVALKLILK